MAFLNKSKMAKRVAAIGVEDHPLLKETKLTESEKTAYVEGLVFAALMDDEKVDEGELETVGRLARSLHMDDAELKNCLETVKGLKTDDEKMAFAEEIVGALKRDMLPVRFVADVESLITKNGEIPPDAADGLDYLGSLLFEVQDWRAERDARQDVLEKTEKAKKAADFKAVQVALKKLIRPFASKTRATTEDLSKLAEFWKDKTLPQVEMVELYSWVKSYSTGEVIKKWCCKAWLLIALIMKKYEAEALEVDELAPLLLNAASSTHKSTEAFRVAFAILAKEYLGEYEAGDDVTSDDESAPESV